MVNNRLRIVKETQEGRPYFSLVAVFSSTVNSDPYCIWRFSTLVDLRTIEKIEEYAKELNKIPFNFNNGNLSSVYEILCKIDNLIDYWEIHD